MSVKIRLGCRPSTLALIQAEQVKKKLLSHFPDITVDVIKITTEGDIDQKSTLQQLGGKGVFIKAIEQQLLDRKIDAAVHSFKDITANIAANTTLKAFLKPESTSDCVVFKSPKIQSLNDLTEGCVVATSSLRRKLFLRQFYPHLDIVDIRGNVETRISKCKSGFCDAVILSTAGLLRLNLEDEFAEELDLTQFVPAPGQGVVTIQTHEDDRLNSFFEAISDPEQTYISNLEYLFLKQVGLNCNYPLGLHTTVENNKVKFLLKWASEDMVNNYVENVECTKSNAEETISKLANSVKSNLN